MKKILAIIAVIAMALILVSCGEKEPTETEKIIDNVKTSISTLKDKDSTYADVKRLIASILDYNNVVDSDKRIVVVYKDDEYSIVEDLTFLMTYLVEGNSYNISYNDKSEVPDRIEILDVVYDNDLINENSVDDEISYEEVQ